MADEFLERVYQRTSADEKVALYDDWATSYDAELGENGYATPGRLAKALARFAPKDAPLLDFGCGSGLSGLALKLAGFQTVDGIDPSAPMRALAEEKRVYRQLSDMDLHDETPINPGSYQTIAAIGALGLGSAPPQSLHMLMKALPAGGHLGFSLNDHALGEPEYEAALSQWLDCGAASLLFKEYGPNLPGKNINSNVYIVEKN